MSRWTRTQIVDVLIDERLAFGAFPPAQRLANRLRLASVQRDCCEAVRHLGGRRSRTRTVPCRLLVESPFRRWSSSLRWRACRRARPIAYGLSSAGSDLLHPTGKSRSTRNRWSVSFGEIFRELTASTSRRRSGPSPRLRVSSAFFQTGQPQRFLRPPVSRLRPRRSWFVTKAVTSASAPATSRRTGRRPRAAACHVHQQPAGNSPERVATNPMPARSIVAPRAS